MITLTLTLADGTVITSTVKRMPRFWKSHLMQLAPYHADYRDAMWERTRDGVTVTSYSGERCNAAPLNGGDDHE